MTTARLNLPEITESQAGKHLTHNEALAMLDVFASGSLDSVTVEDPPTDAEDGDAYLVPVGATGDWAGAVGRIASRQLGEWFFFDMPDGWIFGIADEARAVIRRDGILEDIGGSGGGVEGKTYLDISAGDVTAAAVEQVLQIGGSYTGGVTVTIPAVEKLIVVANDSDQGVTLTTGAGGTIYLEPGFQFIVFGDGTGIRAGFSIAAQGLKMNGDLTLPIYSTSSAPDPTTRYGSVIFVTDGNGGSPCLGVSDGGAWARVALGPAISST